jgi:hypothetical protein
VSKRIHVVLPGLLIVITIALSIGFFYFTFAFPLILAGWKEQGRILSATEIILANVSYFCRAFGPMMFPLLFFGFIGSIVWLIVPLLKKTTGSDDSVLHVSDPKVR